MTTHQPLISVVIATYNRVDLLKHQLHHLLTQSFDLSAYEIIVINDGSTDSTAVYMKNMVKNFPNIHYMETQNGGPAKARNKGVAMAKGQIIAFTDDDCLADYHWLENIWRHFQDEELIAIQGKTITNINAVTPLTHQVINEYGDTSIPTCNAAYRKATLESLGGFDEGFPFQNEDADLAWRARESGKVIFAEDVLILHPPRTDSFRRNMRKMKNYISEFMLYYKNPTLYKKYRYANPWVTIYWRIMVKAQGFHFTRRIKFYKKPLLMIQGFALSLYWWLDLIVKFPEFLKANNFYRTQYKSHNRV